MSRFERPFVAARIERELGWRAGIGLDEGVREMLGGDLQY